MARAGKQVEVQPRDVEIHSLRLLHFDYPSLKMEVACGSGTYIRALGRDIAESLGTAAVMQNLQRTAIGEFQLDRSVTLRKLPNRSAVEEHLLPPEAALAQLPRTILEDDEVIEIAHGRFVTREDCQGCDELAAFDQSGGLVALLVRRRGCEFRPAKNFTGI